MHGRKTDAESHRTCAACGATLGPSPTAGWRRFCSDRCRMRSHRARREESRKMREVLVSIRVLIAEFFALDEIQGSDNGSKKDHLTRSVEKGES